LKNLYISAGILAALAVITSFISSKDNTILADERIGQAIAQDDDLRGVAKVTLRSDGEQAVLSFDTASKQWLVSNRYEMPADIEGLARQIQSITGASLQRLVSEKKERFSDFGFDADEGYLFENADGKTLLALDLGRTTENGRHLIKFGDEEKVFLATDSFSFDANPDSWLKKDLLTFEDSAVRKIGMELQNGDSLEVSRADDSSNWAASGELPEGKQLDQSAVGRVVSRLSGISFTATAQLDDEEVVAAKANGHKITLTLEDETSYSYQIGRRPEVKVMKEVEKEGEDGETTTEMEEEVETPAGKVYYSVRSSKLVDPVNGYMDKAAFEVSSFNFTSLPESLDGLLQDKPEPLPPLQTEETGE
ncbi:MAG: DUF4340 domain-containing protein, partial [Verrucomicrobiota bacterium]